jgi:hypothetical protein
MTRSMEPLLLRSLRGKSLVRNKSMQSRLILRYVLDMAQDGEPFFLPSNGYARGTLIVRKNWNPWNSSSRSKRLLSK